VGTAQGQTAHVSGKTLIIAEQDGKPDSVYITDMPPRLPLHALASGHYALDRFGHCFSSDGRFVALWSFDEDDSATLNVFSTDPSSATPPLKFTKDADFYASYQWHPFLPKLLFVRHHAQAAAELTSLDCTDGTEEVLCRGKLLEEPSADKPWPRQLSPMEACWTPDGTGIVYVEFDSGKGPARIRSMRATGDDPLYLSPTGQRSEYWPVVSPDGKAIAYTRGDGLWVMDLSGAHRRRIVALSKPELAIGYPPIQDEEDSKYACEWTPDSRSIYIADHADCYSVVDKVDLRTGRLEPVGKDAPASGAPWSWCPAYGFPPRTASSGWHIGIDQGNLWFVDETTHTRQEVLKAERGTTLRAVAWTPASGNRMATP
jgi:Tol biopolymer transport system component